MLRAMVAGVIAAGGVLSTAAANASPNGAQGALAGTTVIAGDRSASMPIRVTRSVHVDVSQIDVTGGGRIIGFLLHRDGSWAGPGIEDIQFGQCAAPGCRHVWKHFTEQAVIHAPDADFSNSTGTLPVGRYHLYLVADGAPVRIVLRFRELAGSVTLTPTQPERTEIVQPIATTPPSLTPMLFAAGATHRIGPYGGIQEMILWKQVNNGLERSQHGVCGYDGQAPAQATGTSAYQAPCDVNNPSLGLFLGLGPSTPDGGSPPEISGHWYDHFFTGYWLPPGTYSIGGFVNTAGPVTSAYLQEVWLDFAA